MLFKKQTKIEATEVSSAEKKPGIVKKSLAWIGAVFFLLSAIVYLPSIAGLFMALVGTFLLPIEKVQSLLKKLQLKGKLKTISVIILFFCAVFTLPPSETVEGIEPPPANTELEENVKNNSSSEDSTVSTGNPLATLEQKKDQNEEVVENESSEEVIPNEVPITLPDGSTFSIHFIDVGQADAALIECDGHYMLIDGGNKADSNKIYSVLKKAEVSKLDILVGTHGHEDHIGGLPGAYNYTTADLTLCATTNYDSNAFEDFAKYANEKGGGITIPKVGDQHRLGSATVTILGVNGGSDANNTSIVLKIQYGETSFLFTGDAGREAEQVILNSGVDLSATVLKVGHHGSDISTTYPFLRGIMPSYAIISVGEGNSYGHPTDETLSRLRDADVTVYRTDLQGDIYCTSDGKSVSFDVTRNANIDTLTTPAPIVTTPDPAPTRAPVVTPDLKPEENANTSEPAYDYVGNKNTKKFHYDYCSSVNKMKESNKYYFTGTRDQMISKGYDPCGNCHP